MGKEGAPAITVMPAIPRTAIPNPYRDTLALSATVGEKGTYTPRLLRLHLCPQLLCDVVSERETPPPQQRENTDVLQHQVTVMISIIPPEPRILPPPIILSS